MTQYDPGHGDGSKTVDRADRVAANLTLADHTEVCSDREGQQQLLPHVCRRRLIIVIICVSRLCNRTRESRPGHTQFLKIRCGRSKSSLVVIIVVDRWRGGNLSGLGYWNRNVCSTLSRRCRAGEARIGTKKQNESATARPVSLYNTSLIAYISYSLLLVIISLWRKVQLQNSCAKHQRLSLYTMLQIELSVKLLLLFIIIHHRDTERVVWQ